MASRVSTYLYEFANGSNCKIKLLKDSELEKAYGSQPSAGVDYRFLLVQSKNKREGGLHARTGNWSATVGTGDNAFPIYKSIPILTMGYAATLQASIGSDSPQTITWRGLTWEIKSITEQDPAPANPTQPAPAPSPNP